MLYSNYYNNLNFKNMKKKKVDDEIDIIELSQTLLNNKLKVLLIIVLSISLGYIYTLNQKPFIKLIQR